MVWTNRPRHTTAYDQAVLDERSKHYARGVYGSSTRVLDTSHDRAKSAGHAARVHQSRLNAGSTSFGVAIHSEIASVNCAPKSA